MDPFPFVNEKLQEGRRFLERFAADGNPVDAGFWLAEDDNDIWYLHVACSNVGTIGPRAAYAAVHVSIDKLGPPKLPSSQIKMIDSETPLATDVRKLMAMHTDNTVIRYGPIVVGSQSVDNLYIYPASTFTNSGQPPMTTEEVGTQIVRLMNRGPGMLQSSRVTLKDGTAFGGVPYSFNLGNQNVVVVQFVDDLQHSPRTVRLDEIASIA